MERKYRLNNIELSIDEKVYCRLNTFRQSCKGIPESGGLLIGRTDINGNTKIYEISEPMENDLKSRFSFKRVDKNHLTVLRNANERCLYFKGSWHTHPQSNPAPSWTDKISWKSAMNKSKPGESEYIFFLIVGIEYIRVWCGNMKTHVIEELKYQV